MQSGAELSCCFSLAPSASLATCELCCSDPFSCSSGRSIEPETELAVVIGGNNSLERETFNPALAIDVRLESGLGCLKKAIDSDEVDRIGADEPGSGAEMETGSLFDCINAAIDNNYFPPA